MLMENTLVLIIEDEPSLREFLVTIVEDIGGCAVAVDTADAGVSLLPGQPWSLLVTDVNTPGRVDGWDVAWAAYKQDPTLPVLVTSGGNGDLNGTLPPTALFVSKPWSLEQMTALLESRMCKAGVRSVHAFQAPDT